MKRYEAEWEHRFLRGGMEAHPDFSKVAHLMQATPFGKPMAHVCYARETDRALGTYVFPTPQEAARVTWDWETARPDKGGDTLKKGMEVILCIVPLTGGLPASKMEVYIL